MLRNPRYDTFQKALVDARQKTGLTQQEIAFRLGKPQSFVSKYESGERRLDVIEFLEICQALNIKPQSILKKLGIVDD
jgi:transcriptional regulator with XRE-family HTH domain